MRSLSISLVITHLCDKNCRYCSQRISSSNYEHLTKEQYYEMVKHLKGIKIHKIGLTGGEPLLYPHIGWLIENLQKDFPKVQLVMTTNGTNLTGLTEKQRDAFSRITISWYKGYNEKIVETFKKEKNIFIKNSNELINPYVDPMLSIAAAKKVYKNCSMKIFRFVGTKIYTCCLSEAIERDYQTQKVHLEMNADWLKDIKRIPTYIACQHCFYASIIQNSFEVRLKNRIRNIKKSILSNSVSSSIINFNMIRHLRRAIRIKRNFKNR